jgi:hypothetical protein
MYYPVIKTFKLAEQKGSYTPIHPRKRGQAWRQMELYHHKKI